MIDLQKWPSNKTKNLGTRVLSGKSGWSMMELATGCQTRFCWQTHDIPCHTWHPITPGVCEKSCAIDDLKLTDSNPHRLATSVQAKSSCHLNWSLRNGCFSQRLKNMVHLEPPHTQTHTQTLNCSNAGHHLGLSGLFEAHGRGGDLQQQKTLSYVPQPVRSIPYLP